MPRSSILALSVFCLFAPWAQADTTVMLHDAVRRGLVHVEVKSRGGAAGSTVQVEVQRRGTESLKIEVAPGTVLVNAENAEQNVAVGQLKGRLTADLKQYHRGSVMDLADGQKHTFLLEVFCLDYAKKAPRKGGALSLAVQDKRVARILDPPPGVKPTLGAVQIAIWMDRAGITPDEARRRFRGKTTEVDVQVARQLLAHAEATGVESIPDDLPAGVKVHVTKLFSTDPKVRTEARVAIGQLGVEARPAMQFLVENLLDTSTDKPLPASVIGADRELTREVFTEMVSRLDLPELTGLVDSLVDDDLLRALQEGTLLSSLRARLDDAGLGEATGVVSEMLVDSAIERLNSPLPMFRSRAAQLLGTARDQRAVGPLIQALEDDNQRVRDAAAAALKSLTGKDFGADVAKWKQWQQDQTP